MIHVQVAKAVT